MYRNSFPQCKEYETLYKRFTKRSPEELLKYADIKPGMAVLDICGGNGRLSLNARDQGADVTYIDANSLPETRVALGKRGIEVHHTSIEDYINNDDGNTHYDAILCQSSINYWFLNIDASEIASFLPAGGKFVFNTFIKKPPMAPKADIKQYELDGAFYVETTYTLPGGEYGTVVHIQACELCTPHISVFDYIPCDVFVKELSPYFKIQMIQENTTAIFVCERL